MNKFQEEHFFYKLRHPLEGQPKHVALQEVKIRWYYFMPFIGIAFFVIFLLWNQGAYRSDSSVVSFYTFTPQTHIPDKNSRLILSHRQMLARINECLKEKDFLQVEYYLQQISQQWHKQEKTIFKNDPLSVIQFYNLSAEYAWAKKNDASALTFAQKALNYSQHYYDPQNLLLAEQYELSSFYANFPKATDKEQQESQAYLEKSLAIYRKHKHYDFGKLLIKMNNLGESYRRRQDYDKAEQIFSSTIHDIERRFGIKAPELIIPLNNLGLVHLATYEYTKADLYLKQAYSLAEKTQGEKHPMTQHIASNLMRMEFFLKRHPY